MILTLIRVLSRDRTRVFLTAFTNTVSRPEGLPRNQVVSLHESARGVAPRIRASSSPDDDIGHEFIYRR